MRLGIEDLNLILKERRLCWYGHVEHSNGAVKTAFHIQVEGKRGPGRPKMTWKQLTERHQLSDEAVHNPLQDFHNLLCQLETAVVAPFQYVTFSLVEADNETLLPVRGYLAITNGYLAVMQSGIFFSKLTALTCICTSINISTVIFLLAIAICFKSKFYNR